MRICSGFFLALLIFPPVPALASQDAAPVIKLESEALPLRSSEGVFFWLGGPKLAFPLVPFWDCNQRIPRLLPALTVDQFLELYKRKEAEMGEVSKKLKKDMVLQVNLCRGEIDTEKAGHGLENIDLSEAEFKFALLKSVSFYRTNLSRADFDYANLDHAEIAEVNGSTSNWYDANKRFIGSDYVSFDEAVMSHALIARSELKGAGFYGAYLKDAKLEKTALNGADFGKADLTDAIIQDCDLTGALFAGANVTGMTYEPKMGTIPDLASFSLAKNLNRLTYKTTPARLVEVQEELHKAGLIAAEKAVKTAIDRKRNRDLFLTGEFSAKLESALAFVFAELLTDWGYSPFRPLYLIAAGIFVCFPFYAFFIFRRYASLKNRFVLASNSDLKTHSEILTRTFLPWALGWSFYISLLSAFNIGWHGVDLRAWITKLQTHPFSIRAEGWVRVVTGLQALFSVVMLIVFVVTYFGQSPG